MDHAPENPPLQGEVAARSADGGIFDDATTPYPSTTGFAGGPPPLKGRI
jgi:hypothetical protein